MASTYPVVRSSSSRASFTSGFMYTSGQRSRKGYMFTKRKKVKYKNYIFRIKRPGELLIFFMVKMTFRLFFYDRLLGNVQLVLHHFDSLFVVTQWKYNYNIINVSHWMTHCEVVVDLKMLQRSLFM